MIIYKDQALNKKSEALFGRDTFIDAITNFIVSQSSEVNPENNPELRNQKDNLTIGLYGKWGSGKTSIILCCQAELEEKGFLSVYFDPWLYKSEDLLIFDLFKSITKLIGQAEESLKDKIAGFFKKYASYVTLPKIKFGEFEIDAADTGKDFVKGLGEFLSDDKTIDYYKKEINAILDELANPITIFIDDIDRLDKYEIETLFKTIRLIANFNNVIYVLSFDDDMVAKSVKDNFAAGTINDGFSYLDKIIQIPLRVPTISAEELFDFTFKLLNLQDTPENQIPLRQFRAIHILLFNNPRDCKRFVNSFNFTHFNLRMIDKASLAIMELIRIKYPTLFLYIQRFYESQIYDKPSQRAPHKLIFKIIEEITETKFKNLEELNRNKDYHIIESLLSALLGVEFFDNLLEAPDKYKENQKDGNNFRNYEILKTYFLFKKNIGEINTIN